jgi:hypothetical protein
MSKIEASGQGERLQDREMTDAELPISGATGRLNGERDYGQ